jgi:hypothetical protein
MNSLIVHLDTRERIAGPIEAPTFRLNRTVKNVKEVSLVDIEIPLSYYVVEGSIHGNEDAANGGRGDNNYFVITDSDSLTTPTAVGIAEGDYDVVTLASTLEDALNAASSSWVVGYEEEVGKYHIYRSSGTATIYDVGPTKETGTATAGTATTITIQGSNGHSAVDDYYNGLIIEITGGTGVGQKRDILDYDGGDLDCTVITWVTTPDDTSVYAIYGNSSLSRHQSGSRISPLLSLMGFNRGANLTVPEGTGAVDALRAPAVTLVNNCIELSTSGYAAISAGNYTASELVADLETELLATDADGGYTVTYNSNNYRTTIDISSGEDILNVYKYTSPLLELLGFATGQGTIAAADGSATGDNTINLSGPNSILVHSAVLSRNRRRFYAIDEGFSKTSYRDNNAFAIPIRSSPGSNLVENLSSCVVQPIGQRNTEFREVDFELRFPSGQTVDLHGNHWTLTLNIVEDLENVNRRNRNFIDA